MCVRAFPQRQRVSNSKGVIATVFAGVIAGAIALDFARGADFVNGIDFHTYLAAATVGLRDGWSHIYDPRLVAAAQVRLAPHQWTQPFLSTPPVAWLTAPLTALPYAVAYHSWAAFTLVVLAGALAWSTDYRGVARWVAAGAAIVPWWVIHAVHVGQVAPLLAASVIVSWRLLRDSRDVAAGLVLAALMLKPNTAALVPLALLFAGRWKAFGSWLGATALIAALSIITLGPQGLAGYVNDITHVSGAALRGASQLTVGTAFGLSPLAASATRGLMVAVTLAVMFRMRREPGMAMAAAVVGSLLTTTYLHGSDLCLFGAAGWIVWHERREPAWRAVLAGIWVLATPFLDGSMLAPALNRWVLCEMVVMTAFVVDAWRRPISRWVTEVLTGSAASRRQAPA
jgi:hypothetical protein